MKRIFLYLLLLGFIFPASASKSLLGLSLIPPIQVPDSDSDVTGLRVSILAGNHRRVYGVDFGLIGNITESEFKGLSISGLFNRNLGDSTVIGLQAAGVANINDAKVNVYGLQIALINVNREPADKEYSKGFAVASSGASHGAGSGWEHGVTYGIQLGLYNSSVEVYGFQIGLINFTRKLHGLQIGLLNFNTEGLFAVCPIFNVGF